MKKFEYLDGYMLINIDNELTNVFQTQIRSFLDDGFDTKQIEEYFLERVRREIEVGELKTMPKTTLQEELNLKISKQKECERLVEETSSTIESLDEEIEILNRIIKSK